MDRETTRTGRACTTLVALGALAAMLWPGGAGCGEVDTEPDVDAGPPVGMVPGPGQEPGQEPDQERLVAPGDPRFNVYEIPEQPGECITDADCTLVCTTRCSPVPRGPFTCQADPPPLPEDLAAADCLCVDAVCGFWDPMPPE